MAHIVSVATHWLVLFGAPQRTVAHAASIASTRWLTAPATEAAGTPVVCSGGACLPFGRRPSGPEGALGPWSYLRSPLGHDKPRTALYPEALL